jgi:hypothetical protein
VIKRTAAVTAIVFALTSGAALGDDSDTQPPPGKVIEHAVSPLTVARSAACAGINQATNTPSEWGQGAAGFGRRFGSSFTGHLAKIGIQYPVARLMHEEFGYHCSNKQGFKARFAYALESVVITHKTTTEKAVVSTSELSGAFGAGLISRLWQPASVRGISNGFVAGGILLGADAGGNLLREFWPEIRHPHHHRIAAQPEQPASGE